MNQDAHEGKMTMGPAIAQLLWCGGVWDSTIYNLLMEHPRTVILGIEVVDAETRLPIENAWPAGSGRPDAAETKEVKGCVACPY